MLTALENALVVRLDALEGDRWPTWSLTTTTADAWSVGTAVEISAKLKNAERSLFRWLRKHRFRGRDVQYLGFVEFTTGRSERAAGRRFPHVHHLVKGLPRLGAEDQRRLEADVSARWQSYTGNAWRVESRPLRSPLGALAYLALHHFKREQAPPEGWSGKRFRPSRGYFNRPVGELRAEARALLQDERIERAMVSAWGIPDGFDAVLLDELVHERIDEARELARANAPVLARVHVRHKPIAVDARTGEVHSFADPELDASGRLKAAGGVMSEREWHDFAGAAATARAGETENDRLARLYAEAVADQARRRRSPVHFGQ